MPVYIIFADTTIRYDTIRPSSQKIYAYESTLSLRRNERFVKWFNPIWINIMYPIKRNVDL